jgi:dTDP-4-dehydrorhamnose reductase
MPRVGSMRILVIGASGMIGSATLLVLSERPDWEVFGTVRDGALRPLFPDRVAERLVDGIDVQRTADLIRALERVQPAVVINCAGVTKHQPDSDDCLTSIPINAVMPHLLARLCNLGGARLVQVSSDCVYSGEKGGYVEDDATDARDIYGKSKALGEVSYPNSVTVRTSTIGRELLTKHGLLEWFLSQEGSCRGYTRAVFSGLPTVVLAGIIRDVVIPHTELYGVYNVSGPVITKYDLLQLIARAYGKSLEVVADDRLVVDRSLNAGRFHGATGYVAPPWEEMIQVMYSYE